MTPIPEEVEQLSDDKLSKEEKERKERLAKKGIEYIVLD